MFSAGFGAPWNIQALLTALLKAISGAGKQIWTQIADRDKRANKHRHKGSQTEKWLELGITTKHTQPLTDGRTETKLFWTKVTVR